MAVVEDVVERKCAVCGAVIAGTDEDADEEARCRRCGSEGRYKGKDLVALNIPYYHKRLEELKRRTRELNADIYLEGIKGDARDMKYIQGKHMERQRILTEYSFLSYFREFVDKW